MIGKTSFKKFLEFTINAAFQNPIKVIIGFIFFLALIVFGILNIFGYYSDTPQSETTEYNQPVSGSETISKSKIGIFPYHAKEFDCSWEISHLKSAFPLASYYLVNIKNTTKDREVSFDKITILAYDSSSEPLVECIKEFPFPLRLRPGQEEQVKIKYSFMKYDSEGRCNKYSDFIMIGVDGNSINF